MLQHPGLHVDEPGDLGRRGARSTQRTPSSSTAWTTRKSQPVSSTDTGRTRRPCARARSIMINSVFRRSTGFRPRPQRGE
ncbi:hypothetical protein ACFQ0O_38595 [Saccharopolyspora spinosporotrichia]